ncbi:hypothetical protein [Haloechinothrix halophila]|uniref:hypothetical protein n=1 Tax=Haloechinothrix halophila TaxID=1069073 RepID=UPI00040BBFC8|nr:hypothetical protein [Haloechinothrix halophila]
MRRPVRVAIACALLAGVVAGATACESAEGDAAEDSTSASPSSDGPAPGTGEQAFGDRFTFLNGLSVTVSRPKSFTPSDTAYPDSPRAVAFEIVIQNGTEWPYHLSDLSITTWIGGDQSPELIDTTQGYNGIVDIDAEVPVARKTRMTLAYAADRDADAVRLRIRPKPDASATVTYVGQG